VAFTSANGRTTSSLADINITPLVDVVLVLLVIFMVTAPVLQSGIDVSVPKTRTVKEISEERLVISIDKQQRVFSATTPSTSTRSEPSCARRFAIPAITRSFVRADEKRPFGAFATVMDAVKQSGIGSVSIVTQPVESHAASPEIYFEHAPWGRPIVGRWSCTRAWPEPSSSTPSSFKALAAPCGQWRKRRAMSATLVSSLPLPTVETQSQSVLATESKGLSQSQPVAQTKEPDAIDIPDKNIKKKVTKPVNSTVKPREPEPQPSNQVPFGEGGPAHTFSASAARDLCRSAAAPAISAAALATMCG